MDIMSNEILRQVEKEKDRALTVQIEKNRYLGIYKERVLLALTKNQVEEKLIYKQVEEACQKKVATRRGLSREINFLK